MMEKMGGLLVLLVAAGMIGGCVMPESIATSGRDVTREFDIADFHKVNAADAFVVEITQSDSYGVVITVDERLTEELQVEKIGDTLHIQLKPSVRFNMQNRTLHAAVSMPVLTGLTLSGATRTTIAGFSSEEPLDVQVSGASHLSGDIVSASARFDISGASEVTLEGSASKTDLHVSGASRMDLAGFASGATKVDASGASRVTVNTGEMLDVSASGASRVYYLGDPQIGRVNTSGASTISAR